jgi:hypothetical protein
MEANMLFLRYMLLVGGIGIFVIAAAIVANDMWLVQYRRRTAIGVVAVEPQPIRWRTSIALAFVAWAPLLIALSIVVVPIGMVRCK